MAREQVHRNVYTSHLALTVNTCRTSTIFDVEEFASTYVALRCLDRQVFDVGMALPILFHQAYVNVVFFTVFGVLACFETVHCNVVVVCDCFKRYAIVGHGGAVRDQADFRLTGFIARLDIHDAVNLLLHAVKDDL